MTDSTTGQNISNSTEFLVHGLWAGNCQSVNDTVCLFDVMNFNQSCVSNLSFCNVVHEYQDYTEFDSVLGLGRIISDETDLYD